MVGSLFAFLFPDSTGNFGCSHQHDAKAQYYRKTKAEHLLENTYKYFTLDPIYVLMSVALSFTAQVDH